MILALFAAVPVTLGGPEIRWNAPSLHVAGQPFKVHVEVTAPQDGAVVSGWLLSPGAFSVDGKALAKREESGAVTLPPGFKLEGDVDLGSYLDGKGEFQLAYAPDFADTKPVQVRSLEAVEPKKLDFMTMPIEELDKYLVLLQTNRGNILVRMWPHIAPDHSRNYLDLSYIGFYDKTTFHRVIPRFMIQGGDPTGTGTGNGPRQLKAEFNPAVKHMKGTLSAARTQDPNSASCQFFIMHDKAPHLDGQYSAFGETVMGLDVVDLIVSTPRGQADKPNSPQVIERAIVVLRPSWVPAEPSQTKNGPPSVPVPVGGK
ncbi:MAG: peptidylprolyl isomerase [Planctomycetota bacterium]|nr:peptidylprolyl isomerase [Planctomycetota bacterium]